MPPNNTSTRETKTLHFQVKATGETSEDGQEFGQVECYGAIFDNVDDGNDRINKGAFTRTIQNSKARAKSREKKYILPILWQHDTNELIGGWYDLKEDETGLLCKGEIALATQRGREYYALAKAGMSDQFSIIYDIPSGGAKYDKSGVRDLTEVRLFSIDVVTFAMNDETKLVRIKSMDMEYKTACGSTSGPIGPRDDSWDGAAAKKWIWGKAEGDDGKVKASVAKKYFMRCDGDPSEKGSYSYPFWINDHISVAGVKAVANALSGARNADPEGDAGGMRKKVERLYGRINSKYPDNPLPPVPWKNKDDDGKSLDDFQTKSLMDHYQEEMAGDLLEDWQEVYICSLSCAMLDALKEGGDVGQVLDDFKTLILTKFVPQAEDVDLADYLEAQDSTYNSADSIMQYGSRGRSYYGYMSDRRRHGRKAGRSISATNAGKIQDHIDSLKAMAREHMKVIHSAADDFAGMMGGSSNDDDNGDEEQEDQQTGKQLALALAEIKGLRK